MPDKKTSQPPISAPSKAKEREWATQDRESDTDQKEQRSGAEGQADELPDGATTPIVHPDQSPLFHAQHSERYSRQQLIGEYQDRYGCRLARIIHEGGAPGSIQGAGASA